MAALDARSTRRPQEGSVAEPWKPCGVYWMELTAEVPCDAADAVASMFFEHGASSVHEIDKKGTSRVKLRGHLLWVPDVDGVIAALRRALRRLGRSCGGSCTLRARQIFYVIPMGPGGAPSWCFDTPMPVAFPDPIGERVVVKDPHDPFVPSGRQVVVELLPSRAFGNGAHDTTRLCCRALERFVQPGDNVVDIGTGSGLLALAAARLGAGRVSAFDIEEEAVRATRENIAQNRLEGVVSALHADQMEGTARRLAGRIDLVVANLLPWVIEQVTPQVKQMLRPGGIFVMSGLRADAVQRLDLSVLAQGFDVVDVAVSDEWCCLVYANVGPPLEAAVLEEVTLRSG